MVSLGVYSVLLAIYLVVLWRTPDRDPGEEDVQPEGEAHFLKVAQVLMVFWFVSFVLPYVTPAVSWFDAWWCAGVGAAIFAMGTGVRTLAIRTLGENFTYALCIRKEHELVQKGLYRWIRHPSYTGTLLEVIGMMVAARSLAGLLVFLVSAGWLFTMRIEREERMLRGRFGQAYEAYMARTKRFVPWLF